MIFINYLIVDHTEIASYNWKCIYHLPSLSKITDKKRQMVGSTKIDNYDLDFRIDISLRDRSAK